MTVCEKMEQYAEMQEAYKSAIRAVENCKPNWDINYYSEKIRDEMKKDECDRDNETIQIWEGYINVAKEGCKRFDAIEEQLFKLMTGATIK